MLVRLQIEHQMRLTLICSIAFLVTISTVGAGAHPMGNFTINHYSRLAIEKDALRLHYVLDMAELPTVVERQDMDRSGDNVISDAETKAYLQSRTPRWLGNLTLAIDGKPAAWSLKRAKVKFTPGVANLATMRIELDAMSPLTAGKHDVAYKDANYAERPGWKEMVVISAPGVQPPVGNAPNKEISRELRAYPTDLLSNPPQDSGVEFAVEIPAAPVPPGNTPKPKPRAVPAKPATGTHRMPDSPTVEMAKLLGIDLNAPPAPVTVKARATKPKPVHVALAVPVAPLPKPPVTSTAPPPSRWARVFHSLVAVRHLTPAVLLTSLLIAFCLGGIHALQPGHGKTLVAAYLVGQRGTARHAILLGITVTLSHTFGVFLLGAVALYGSQFILPEILQPWMGVASGVLVALIGGGMLASRLRDAGRERAHLRAHAVGDAHNHHHQHEHHHHDHGAETHSHGPQGEHTHAIPDSITLGSLLALGVSGGIVPCPDALIVLLGAIAIHQTLYGMGLIVAFSAGLAVTLTAAGLAVVWGQKRTPLARLTPRGVRTVSIIGNSIVLAIGIALALQSLIATGVLGRRG